MDESVDGVVSDLAKVSALIEGACKCDSGSATIAAAKLLSMGINARASHRPAKVPVEPENSTPSGVADAQPFASGTAAPVHG